MAANIVATRIDDRLIHGQGMVWLRALPITTLIVVNDEVAVSDMEQGLMRVLVPASIELRFFSVQKLIDVIHRAADRQKIFLVFKTIEDVDQAIENKVPIKEINIGNVRKKSGSIKISPYMNLVDHEFKIIEKWLKAKIQLNSKQTPAGAAKGEHVDFESIVKRS